MKKMLPLLLLFTVILVKAQDTKHMDDENGFRGYKFGTAVTEFKNMPDNTLYIYASNSFEAWNQFGPSLKPSPNDQIVGSDSTLGGMLLVYRKK